MIKVTLLGDSIRQIGYGTAVPTMLGEDYKVYQPTDNCRFVKYTLRMLFDHKSEIEESDIIHWNNGLWDASVNLFGDGRPFTDKGEYISNMIRTAAILKKLGKRIIFATTTPVLHDYEYGDNAVIDEYNVAVVPELIRMGIEINDLNSFVKPHINEYIRDDDKIHLTDAGIEACARRVVEFIKCNRGRI